jgi:hypothetical protein
MPRSPAKSLTSTAASPPDTSLDPPRDALAEWAQSMSDPSAESGADSSRCPGSTLWPRAAKHLAGCR